jgi:hypothetical protein
MMLFAGLADNAFKAIILWERYLSAANAYLVGTAIVKAS